MITYGGELVTLNSGAPSIHSIGVSLGRISRFCGHTELYYTVLAHTLTVAELMPPEYGIYGLMHDAPESLVSDVPTPMKTRVARNREYKLLERIYLANGLPWPIPEEAQEYVDEADHLALVAEAHILKHPGSILQWGDSYDELAGKLTRKNLRRVKSWLDPAKSGASFERAFNKYTKLAGLQVIEAW